MFYVWLAFIFAGWSFPAWRWLRRKRAAGWPVADGRIESVEVGKPTFSFTTKRGYYVAELGYSYSIAGTTNSGHYRREFPTEREAGEFVRDLQGKAVVVRYNPNNPSSSMLLELDIEAVLQNRAPAPIDAYPLGSVPNWLRPYYVVFRLLLCCRPGCELVGSSWSSRGEAHGTRTVLLAFACWNFRGLVSCHIRGAKTGGKREPEGLVEGRSPGVA
jgi:hypothetical protein